MPNIYHNGNYFGGGGTGNQLLPDNDSIIIKDKKLSVNTDDKLDKNSKHPIENGAVATSLEEEVASLREEVLSLRSTINTYGLSQLSISTAITENNGSALSASEKNPGVNGSIMARIVALENAITDTGWKELTLINGWHAFENNEWNKPVYRKIGKVVTIHGAVSGNFNPGNNGLIIAQLPAEFRPAKTVYQRCQGSFNYTWLFTIFASGNIEAARYGYGNTDVPGTDGVWLPFTVMYLTA